MKNIDKLVVKSFVGPYVLSFFIAEFVLVMQFLWKYIDELIGKGFSIFDFLELIVYNCITIIPLALPISILLASVMVFGDISERNELTAMKATGTSLLRVMRPGLIIAIFTALFSLIASNYLKPTSNYYFRKKLELMRTQKLNLILEEGFNEDFRNFAINIKEKDPNGEDLKGVLIYDHTTPDKSLINLLTADSARMFTSENGKFFVMDLKHGSNYQEGERKFANGRTTFPLTRTYFREWKKVFDMSEFLTKESDINVNRKREDMLNSLQLIEAIDTFHQELKRSKKTFESNVSSLIDFKPLDKTTIESKMKFYHASQKALDSLEAEKNLKIVKDKQESIRNAEADRKKKLALLKEKVKDVNKAKVPITQSGSSEPSVYSGLKPNKTQQNSAELSTANATSPPNATPSPNASSKPPNGIKFKDIPSLASVSHFYELLDKNSMAHAFQKSVSNANLKSESARSVNAINESTIQQIEMYRLRLHQQFSFATICILFLFVGAPLGSIIRKGGYGYPLLFAILFYMLFVITNIMGEKLVKSGSIYGAYGAWIPCLIQLPLAILFTNKALADSPINIVEWLDRQYQKYILKRKYAESI